MGEKRGHYAKTFKYSKQQNSGQKERWESSDRCTQLYSDLAEPVRELGADPDSEKGVSFRREIASLAYEMKALHLPPSSRIGKPAVVKLLSGGAAHAGALLSLLEQADNCLENRFPDCFTQEEAVGAAVRSSLWGYYDSGNRVHANFDAKGDKAMAELIKLLHVFKEAMERPDFGLAEDYFNISSKGGRPLHPERRQFIIQTVLAWSDISGKSLFESAQDASKFAKVYRGIFGLSLQDIERFIKQIVNKEFALE